ncbi:MAG: hypothetical protein WC119_05135 [Synergistaceae bacterium]
MEQIIKQDSLEEYQRKMAHNRRIILQAKAILSRAKKAGIPEKYMRINREAFMNLLDTDYHKNVEEVADFVYERPMDLLKKEFIIIDGGGQVERKRAGFAVLFRLIACDRFGLHKDIGNVAHDFQSLGTSADGVTRNDLAESLRKVDLLLLSEYKPDTFRKGFETGQFFDDVLTYRDDYVKTTIVTMFNPLAKNRVEEDLENVMTEKGQYGVYVCSMTQADQTKDPRFYRIRVKK